MARKKRRQYLVNKPLQLNYAAILAFWVAITALATAFAMLCIFRRYFPGDATTTSVDAEISQDLDRCLLVVATIIVLGGIITLIAGILLIHRIAGPAHRLERHLRLLAGGASPQELRMQLRKKDYLGDLTASFNLLVVAIGREREMRREIAARAGKLLEEIARQTQGEIAAQVQDVLQEVHSLEELPREEVEEEEGPGFTERLQKRNP